MENIKDNLDKRICDCLENATNTETYREFIVNAFKDLGVIYLRKKLQIQIP